MGTFRSRLVRATVVTSLLINFTMSTEQSGATLRVTASQLDSAAQASMPAVRLAGSCVGCVRLTTPTGIAGSSQVLIQPSAQQGQSGDVSGNFRFICGFSHMSYDDPVVFPNQPGKAHLHTFFGNTGTNAASTYVSLRSSGNGTCSGGIANRSSYWVPTLLDPNGQPVAPDYLQVYYKSGYRKIAPSQINNLPNGLVMLAGTASSMTDQSSEIVEWYCDGAANVTQHITDCGAGHTISMGITFPQCWDGVHLDSPDHKSHMAYPGSGSDYGKGCPATHPVAIPVMSLTVFWTQPAGNAAKIRLASDMAGATPGASAHGDYMEAWDPTIRDGWTENCVRAHRDCTRGLGDARQLVDPPGL